MVFINQPTHPPRNRFNDMGIFYAGGMGCHRHHNCFTCPIDDCKFICDNKSASPDLKFLANRGDGINYWEYAD